MTEHDTPRFYLGADDDSECTHDWGFLPEPDDDVMQCAHCKMLQR
jgi:hypothetical protein